MRDRTGQALELHRPDLNLGDYVVVVVKRSERREDSWECLVLHDSAPDGDVGVLVPIQERHLERSFREVG